MAFVKPTADQLRHRYSSHPANHDQADRYVQVRETILAAATACVTLTPCSPEQARALNALDEAMFLFNAAIARGE